MGSPEATVSQALHEYLLFQFPGCLSLKRGERRHDSERLKAWEESAVFGVTGELPEDLFRAAVERYYSSAGFTCRWHDLGAGVYLGEDWWLSVTVTFPLAHTTLFLTVVNDHD